MISPTKTTIVPRTSLMRSPLGQTTMRTAIKSPQRCDPAVSLRFARFARFEHHYVQKKVHRNIASHCLHSCDCMIRPKNQEVVAAVHLFYMHRAHEDAKQASTRNKAALTMSVYLILSISLVYVVATIITFFSMFLPYSLNVKHWT